MAETAPVGLDQIMKAADLVTTLANNAAQLLIGGAKKAADIQEGRETAAKEGIKDAVAIETQKGVADLNAQQNARKAASAFAINMDEANQMVVSMGEKFVTNSKKALALAEDITKRQSVRPWDDPIGWIGNQIVIPFQEEELQAATQAAGIAQKTLVAANDAVQEQVVTENAIKESVTTETQAAMQRQLLRGAEENLAKLRLQGIALNSGNLKAVLEMTSTQMDTYLKINQVFNSQKYLEMAQQTHALNVVKWNQELKDRLEVTAEEASIADTVNTGRAALNLPALPAKHIKQQLKMGGEISKILQDNYITGSAIKSSGAPIIGESPAKAAQVIVQSQAPLTTEQQVVKSFVVGGVTEAAGKLPPNVDAKANPKAAADYVNKQVLDAAKRQHNAIKTGDATNIYAASSLKAITAPKDIQESQIYQKILSPLIAAGYDKVDPDDLVSKTIAAIEQGQIDYNQGVLGLAVIFKSAKVMNNETRRYRMFGLPTQEKYTVKFNYTFGPLPAGTDVVDMSDPAKVSVLLSRRMALSPKADIRLGIR